MGDKVKSNFSAMRLRLGVVLIIFWWIPIYLLVPTIVASLNVSDTKRATGIVTLTIVIFQTMVGLLGALLAGKQLVVTLRKVKLRKIPKAFWHLLWTGNKEISPDYLKVPNKKAKQA